MKKRIAAFALALLTVASGFSTQAVGNRLYYNVYDISFENGTDGFSATDDAPLLTEEGALLVKRSENGSIGAKIALPYVDKKSKSNISVRVRAIGTQKADVSLCAVLVENGTKNSYILDRKTVSASGWTTLSGDMLLKYRDLDTSAEIELTAINPTDGCDGIIVDDFKVISDKPSLNVVNPVEEIKNDGTFKMRFSFETGTIERFLTTDYGNYAYVSPEYEITDEVPAHSGKYCLRFCQRYDFSQMLALQFPNLPKNAKLNITYYVRNAQGIKKQKYILQGLIPVAEGKKWPWLSSYYTAENDEWVKIEGVLDTSDYTMTDSPIIRFSTTNESNVDFYIDDILITGNFAGEFYDDMQYTPREPNDEISDTPSEITPKIEPIQEDIPSLKDVYREYFKIGSAITQDAVKPGRYENLIKKHCNTVVGESSFKMGNILKDPKNKTNYNFTYGDQLMEFAAKNGIDDIVGHCLIWDLTSYIPYCKDENNNWLTRDATLKFMEEYIDKVIKHFEGDGDPSEYIKGAKYSSWHLNAWDVVNEAASEATIDGYKRTGGSWINAVGKDYIDYAYEYARKTCDENGYDISLRYNDYGEENPKKRDAVYNLVKGLLDKGVQIDSLGIQSHYKPNTSSATIRAAVEKYASLGLPMDITEIDIAAYTAEENARGIRLYDDGLPKEVEYTQANLYYELFELYKEYADQINRVVTWTISDRLAYANYTKFIKEDYAGIFDRDYRAKPQFWAIADSKKYFTEILKEDTSRIRLSVDSKILAFEDEASLLEKGGVVYADADELLTRLNIKYVKLGDKITVINNGKYLELTVGSDTINSDFKEKRISSAVLSENKRVYIPVVDVCTELGFGTTYSQMRNMVAISTNAVGEALI